MGTLQRHKGLLLAIFGGAIAALATPPTDLYPALFVGLALLALSLSDAHSATRAFGRGAAWATAAGIVGMRFVPAVVDRFTPLGLAAGTLALVLLAAAQSLLWAIGAAVTNLVHRRTRAPFEVAFAAGTFVAVSLPSVFAWTPAGVVSPWPALVQLADIIGERGVSVIFAVIAALLARAANAALSKQVRRQIIVPLVASASILAVVATYGFLRIRLLSNRSANERTLRIALVNQAVAPLDRWDPKNHPAILQKLHALTQRAEAQGVDLTVWPEAAYPYPLEHGETRNPRGVQSILGKDLRGPILFGLIMLEMPVVVGNGRFERNSRNSATIVSPDGSLQPSYDKLELLWFGETIPLGAYFPWLRRVFQKSGGLVPGTEARALVLPRADGDVKFGVLNCYEDTLTDVGRRVAREVEPHVLVNVTNDAWFLNSAEPELHARLARMRAIEHRVHLVRSVNLGVMSWVDDRGIEVARDDSQRASTLIVTPAIGNGSLTVYGRFGNAPLAGLLTAAVAAFAWRARRDSIDRAEKAGDKNETSASEDRRAGSS